MNTNWKKWVVKKAETRILKMGSPLLIKEAAFQAIKFAVKCGQSNPLSYALRPIVAHQRLRSILGVQIAAAVIIAAIFQPLATHADNTGGAIGIVVATDGDVSLKTQESVQIPIKNYFISQGFWLLHPGIDMASTIGEPIRPIMKGVVEQAEYNWFGYGNMVIIRHSPEYESLYGHLSKIEVKVGQTVDYDTEIGLVGSTGHSTGPHLHLEVHEEGKAVNPLPILGIK